MEKYQLEIFCFDAGVCDTFFWVDINDLNLPAELLQKMADWGIIEIKEEKLRTDHIARAYKALRLHRSLGVNLSGIAVILELLDRIDQMNEELEQWRRQW